MNEYRVLLADDHPLIRAGIADLLEGDPRLLVCGQVESFTALWDALEKGPLPHVVVMDLKMPGGTGLAAVTRLHQQYPSVRILVLTTFPEESFVVLMIRAGASGYLEKTASAERIVDAIHSVAAGELVVSPAGARVLARALGPGRVHTHLDISDRELEVLRLMGSGLTASQIAQELGISVKTVSTYRARLSEKMGLVTSAEIIRYALEHGLAD